MEAGHTATPWEACGQYIRTTRNADGSGGFLVAEIPANTGSTIQDAEFIVTACNEHATLKRKAEELDAENKELHRKLAAAELDAKTAWSRYENANSSRITTEQQLETAVRKADSVDGAIALLKRLKRDLEHARRFSPDTLNTYRHACVSAEGDIEEFLNALAAAGA